jgi:hypothetical protein
MNKVFGLRIPSFLTPDQNLSGKKFPIKIEKDLQAPIIFFPPNWYWGVSLEPSYQTRINAVGSQSSLPPKKKPKHSLLAESAWQPFFGPRKAY